MSTSERYYYMHKRLLWCEYYLWFKIATKGDIKGGGFAQDHNGLNDANL